MHYVDTSVLVTALTVEPESPAAMSWLVDHQETAFLSDWTLTEFAGALARKRRMGDIDDRTREGAHELLDRLSRESLVVLPVTSTDFREAVGVCRADVGLRSADALHVAVARAHRFAVISRDQVMVAGARQLGLDAVLLGAA